MKPYEAGWEGRGSHRFHFDPVGSRYIATTMGKKVSLFLHEYVAEVLYQLMIRRVIDFLRVFFPKPWCALVEKKSIQVCCRNQERLMWKSYFVFYSERIILTLQARRSRTLECVHPPPAPRISMLTQRLWAGVCSQRSLHPMCTTSTFKFGERGAMEHGLAPLAQLQYFYCLQSHSESTPIPFRLHVYSASTSLRIHFELTLLALQAQVAFTSRSRRSNIGFTCISPRCHVDAT